MLKTFIKTEFYRGKKEKKKKNKKKKKKKKKKIFK